jgi:signal transduction histidine kinase
MKPNVLQAPLIKSAIVLVIFSLLFYFTSTSPEGSVWGSIGSIFIVAFRTIQWALALAISLIVSLAVLIGIFYGAVALVSPTSASRMYEGLRQTLLAWFTPLITLFKSEREEKLAASFDAFGQDLKKEFASDIQAAQVGLSKTQAELETRLGGLSSRLTTLEEATTGLAAAEQLEAMVEEVDTLKSSVEQTAGVDITGLEKDIAGLQSGLASVQQKAEEALQTAAKAAQQPEVEKKSKQEKVKAAEKDEHRIFSYFDAAADKKKVADLVASTLKKDMNYDQIMNFVAKELGGNKGKIITSHPSLSKDYIRQCRRKG